MGLLQTNPATKTKQNQLLAKTLRGKAKRNIFKHKVEQKGLKFATDAVQQGDKSLPDKLKCTDMPINSR